MRQMNLFLLSHSSVYYYLNGNNFFPRADVFLVRGAFVFDGIFHVHLTARMRLPMM